MVLGIWHLALRRTAPCIHADDEKPNTKYLIPNAALRAPLIQSEVQHPWKAQLAHMKCPFCGFANDKVVDSRESKEGESIRRRRECLKCEKRFTTYERIDEIPYMVVKKDGRREKFERQKVLAGVLRACEKRPVSMGKMEQVVNEVEQFVVDSPERERTASEIGELIMDRLKQVDKVAYIRFASVYRDFQDVSEFHSELEQLLQSSPEKPKTSKAKAPVK